MTFLQNWKTTASAIAVLLVWILPKVIPGLEIPEDVKVAITTIIFSVGLLFARDHNK